MGNLEPSHFYHPLEHFVGGFLLLLLVMFAGNPASSRYVVSELPDLSPAIEGHERTLQFNCCMQRIYGLLIDS
jgi:hypothetical protein